MTIPAVGTAITFLIFSGVLLILGLVYFISAKTGWKKCAVSAATFILCTVLGSSGSFAFWESGLLYEGESIYNYLQVKNSEDDVILSTNVLFGVQSIMKKDRGLTGMYYDYAMAAPFMSGGMEEGESTDILILGMGTGTYATQCRRYLPFTEIEGVEIDEKITKLAGEYFELDEDIPVTTYDGRAYLNAIEGTYDVIMVDAYQDITIPFQMSSVEFFTMVHDHLNEDGVMVVNMNMRGSGEGNINEYLSDTIASVFGNVYTVDVQGSTNRELFASDNPDMTALLKQNLSFTEDEALCAMMERVEENLIPYDGGGYIMTDDKAPVELLGMQVIDALIQEELGYYKEIFKREGIQGLLNQV